MPKAEFSHFAAIPFDGVEVVVGAVVIRLPKSTTAKKIADDTAYASLSTSVRLRAKPEGVTRFS
jgi:hypothetical protein